MLHPGGRRAEKGELPNAADRPPREVSLTLWYTSEQAEPSFPGPAAVTDEDRTKRLEAADRQASDFRGVRDRAFLAVLIFCASHPIAVSQSIPASLRP